MAYSPTKSLTAYGFWSCFRPQPGEAFGPQVMTIVAVDPCDLVVQLEAALQAAQHECEQLRGTEEPLTFVLRTSG
jgi:hypothetical protein